MSGWRARLADERGAVLPLVAVALVALLAATSLSIDVGRIANRRRDLQAITDMVALDAATRLQGATLGELGATPAFLDAVASAAERNGFAVSGAATPGAVDGAGTFAPGGSPANAWRLVESGGPAWLLVALGTRDGSGAFAPAPDDLTVPTTVRVAAGDDIEYSFAPFDIADASTDREAVAETAFAAGVGVRTSVASLDSSDGVVLDRLLGSFLGVSVGAVDYRGLVGAGITLGELAADLGAATMEDLLATEVQVRDLLVAQATVLEARGDTARATILETVAAEVDLSLAVTLGELVTLDAGGNVAAAAASLDVLELLTATAMLLGGDHVLSLTGAELAVPGVADVPVELTIIEAPQYAFGPAGVRARTAQVELELAPVVSTAPATYGGDKCQLQARGLVTGLLECLVGGLLGIIDVPDLLQVSVTGTVPLVLEVARGEVELTDVVCRPLPADRAATVEARDIGGVALDAGASLTAAVDLTRHGGPTVSLDVGVSATTAVAARPPASVTFTADDMGTFEPVPDGPVVALAPTAVTVAGGADVLGLVTVSGELPVVVSNVALAPVNAVVAEVLAVLDRALGLGIAGAEVTALAPACATSALVG